MSAHMFALPGLLKEEAEQRLGGAANLQKAVQRGDVHVALQGGKDQPFLCQPAHTPFPFSQQ